ncbi:MAG: DUF433 domain-containing protein [Limisphaerales bacterium]
MTPETTRETRVLPYLSESTRHLSPQVVLCFKQYAPLSTYFSAHHFSLARSVLLARRVDFQGSMAYKGGMNFTRITSKPAQMGGVPCIRGLRIPVATVVGMVADGMTVKEILHAYSDLQAEDVAEALRFAAETVRERELPLLAAT